jgi:hypothetical protein
MDTKHIESEIKRFRDIIVENRDDHFQEYIVMDMLDAGEPYLIDDLNWYYHWLDVLRDLSQLMDNLIQEHYDGHKEYISYIKECVQLKQILDKDLLENPNYNPDEVVAEMRGELFIEDQEERQDFIRIRVETDKSQKIIKSLYNQLNNKGFINPSLNEFTEHFNPSSKSRENIQWYGTEVQITALFLNLVYHGIIDRSYEYRIPSTISIHFINKKGKAFSDHQLRVSLSRVRSGDVDHLISEIVEMVEGLTEIN